MVYVLSLYHELIYIIFFFFIFFFFFFFFWLYFDIIDVFFFKLLKQETKFKNKKNLHRSCDFVKKNEIFFFFIFLKLKKNMTRKNFK